MQVFRSSLLCLFSACTLCSALPAVAQSSAAQGPGAAAVYLANPLVGTAPLDNQAFIGNAPPPGEQLYSGFVPPGPLLPQAPFETGPVNANLPVAFPAGVPWPYYYPNPTMFGFTSGGPGGPMLEPVVGDWTAPPGQQASYYDKKTEHASPGYYSVDLNTFGVRAEMTSALYSSLYRFTFPQTEKAHLLLWLDGVAGHVERVDDRTIRGTLAADTKSHQYEMPGADYFVAEFSKPLASYGTFQEELPGHPSLDGLIGGSDVQPGASTVDGNFPGLYIDFHTTAGEQILVKIAHGYSYAEAEARLKAEQPGWDFEGVRKQAETAWADKLGRIWVEGGTPHERALFYSTLLHSYTSPRLIARRGETYVGLDEKEHVATDDLYSPVPFWDTGRNQIALMTLIEPEVMRHILDSQYVLAQQKGYMGTSFHGDNAVFMYLAAWKEGIPFDHAGVYQYLRKNATDPAGPRHYLAEYMKQGWISDIVPAFNPNPPYAGGKAGAATTLEYAWDDYALSQYAKKLGRDEDAAMFLKRAHYYHNVFDPAVGFMRGRTADGAWASPAAGPDKGTLNPQEPYYNFMMKEASGWSTLWLVPQDVAGLANLLGGREKAAAKLDAFFSTPYSPKGICRDCTGLVGQYVQGNQPDQQAAYYYDWLGQPWKTQQLVRRILAEMYGSDRAGLAYPGMDDQGSTSSWYVMSAMGFYPVDPSSTEYLLGSPIFNRITMQLAGGKTFTTVATNNSAQNIFIQSATLNGKPWNKPWFSYADIASGGTLTLTMGPKPNKDWGAAIEDAPPSMATFLAPGAQAGAASRTAADRDREP